MKWSEMPHCTAGVMLTATDTIASPRAERFQVSGPGQSHSCRALCLPMPCHAIRERADTKLKHSSTCVAFSPGHRSARDCIWSFHFCVWGRYSQCPNSRKRQHQKQSPTGKTQGRASDTKHRDRHLTSHRWPHRCCQLSGKCPFQTTQEKFKGEAPETEGSSHQSSSLVKSPRLSCFLFPMSRSSLQNTHMMSEEPGHLTASRHLQSLLQKAEQVRSEPSGQHNEFFHPASPQLFYPSTFKKQQSDTVV